MKNALLLLSACLGLTVTTPPAPARAQSRPAAPEAAETGEAPVFPSPAGVYAVVSNTALSAAKPSPEGLVAVRVLRAPAGSNDFKEVGQVRQAGSLAEFRQQAGPGVLEQIRQTHQLASDDAAWAYLQAHPSLDDYGFLGLSLSFRVALGTAFLDADAVKAKPGTRFAYRLVPEYATGRAPSGAGATTRFPEATVAVGQRSALPRPRARRATGRDSAVVVRWVAPAARANTPLITLFGRVWRQGPGEKTFSVVADQILATRDERGRDDSVRFTFQQRVEPEALYRYYIEPLDFVGNPGPVSDTAYVLSVSPSRMPAVSRVNARDTTDGIALSWPALPAKPYLLGIEVQRSRDTRGNYVRLDTIPASAAGYLDTRLLPNVTYHYRLRTLLRGGLRAPEAATGAAFASHQGGEGRSSAPLAPVQLTAEPEGRGVRLRWQPAGPDLNHEAYFVYRGTSDQDSMVVVSPALRGGTLTFLDTTARNGRRQYVYAVQDVNKNLQASPFSDHAAAQPNIPMAVAAPLGLSGYSDGAATRLSWDDVQRRDPAVVGYRVYRRPAAAATPAPKPAPAPIPRKGAPSKSTAAPAVAAAPGFVLLADDLRAPAYEDATMRPGQAYQYAVSALDAQGTESALSPVATPTVFASTSTAAVPPSQLNARAVPKGLEVSWSHPAVLPGRGYALYRRTREQPEPQRLATLPATATRYLDATARPQVLYIYSVAVLTPAQEGPRTSEISARR
ncbi:hypothetical protein [Hymenobacter ruricola]|uniref:Fibronectin type-III domain-containing protein n=1 Tax=Hymenobacter ruricola TaxID=2791023 RepID=A0ABS0HZX7_9BACT|nr:hypothetical protein [Hymenobacter ruricola]MBF9220257.1 hypothetical protein [Hymenobacter ruricola]